jgi:SAM-dependent methyltransferase
MSFQVAASAYDHFMGRYSRVLAPLFADFAGIRDQQRVLDVGCGPGALTGVLVERLGAEAVVAVDPSEPFVAAMRERFPEVELHHGSAEDLPFPDRSFVVTLAQLVVHHMTDPIAGIREMARVTSHGGTVAACVWDHDGGVSPLGAFWAAASEFDPEAPSESGFVGARPGHLVELFEQAGLVGVEGTALEFEVTLESFDEWWAPFPLGVGPAGQYVAGLDEGRRAELRELCRRYLPSSEPFDLPLRVWAARAQAT